MFHTVFLYKIKLLRYFNISNSVNLMWLQEVISSYLNFIKELVRFDPDP